MIHSIDHLSRLAMLGVEADETLVARGEEGYKIALERLMALKLKVKVSDEISQSIALQAALVTIVNSGKRAFKGGVFIDMPNAVQTLIPWDKPASLNKIILDLGGTLVQGYCEASFTLTIGLPARDINSLQVVANGWQGGVLIEGDTAPLSKAPDGIAGGIFSGAFATALAFLRVSGEKKDCITQSKGISLWRPDLNWTDPGALGPAILNFPSKLWIAGLGHLGQAFIWLLGLLPFKEPDKFSITLQDKDCVSASNLDTGLLTEVWNVEAGLKKTRVCAEWLEARGITTNIVERFIDDATAPQKDESDILICGMDSAEARSSLNIQNFKVTIDCGIGGSKSSFDSISVHNFPVCENTPAQLWQHIETVIENKNSEKLYKEMFGCGSYDKGIGTSFVGAISACLVFSEILRMYHKGKRFGHFNFAARNHKNQLLRVSLLGDYGMSHTISHNGIAELKYFGNYSVQICAG